MDNTQAATPSRIEVRKHLWEVWYYRHGFFWGALIRWGIAVLTISAVPHVYPHFVLTFQWVVVFPVTAVLLTVFSFFHLLAEHQRLVLATEDYLTESGPRPPPRAGDNAATYATREFVTGPGVIVMYLVALLLICVANGIYLTSGTARKAAAAQVESSANHH